MIKDENGFEGVWRTIRGRRVFIRKGESLDSAMKRATSKITKIEYNNKYNCTYIEMDLYK